MVLYKREVVVNGVLYKRGVVQLWVVKWGVVQKGCCLNLFALYQCTSAVLQFSSAQVIECSNSPVLHCSAPVLQGTIAPVLQGTCVPVYQCTIAPVHQRTIAPILHFSSTPVFPGRDTWSCWQLSRVWSQAGGRVGLGRRGRTVTRRTTQGVRGGMPMWRGNCKQL